MLPLGTESLRTAIVDLRSAVEFHDLARVHFLDEPDLGESALEQGAPNYLEARRGVPPTPSLQVYGHCASVTRLYAIYESYVYDLVRSWLAELCLLVHSWADFPAKLCANYRPGIGVLLQKFGGPRTAHLIEVSIVESLYRALKGEPNIDLVPDAFFVELQNLRETELHQLFDRVGLSRMRDWLNHHPSVREHCEQYGVTIEGRLKELVAYRNVAAHGAIDVDEVLGKSEFFLLAEFVELLCLSLSELVRHEVVQRAEALGKYQVVGVVTEYFAKPQASIAKMQPVQVRCGDMMLARSASECFVASIRSIQIDNVGQESVDAALDQELGICFEPVVSRGCELLIPRT